MHAHKYSYACTRHTHGTHMTCVHTHRHTHKHCMVCVCVCVCMRVRAYVCVRVCLAFSPYPSSLPFCLPTNTTDNIYAAFDVLCYGSITSHTHSSHHIHCIASHHIHHIASISSHHIHHIIHRITPLTLLVNLLTCHVHFYNIYFCIFYVI